MSICFFDEKTPAEDKFLLYAKKSPEKSFGGNVCGSIMDYDFISLTITAF